MAMVATKGFWWATPKGLRRVNLGDVLKNDDPAVKHNPAAFRSTDDVDRPVEQATAAPGEKRTAKPKAKKKS